MTTAALLIAHGSRRQEANDDLVRLAEIVRAREQYEIVEISYLEIAEPSIPEGGRTCVRRGASRVLMLPFFLSAGSHVTDDLKTHRDAMAREHPGVEFQLCPPLGLHPLLVEVVFERLREGAGE